MNYVFYKGKLHSQYDPRVYRLWDLPAFSWVYNSEQGYWYYMETSRVSTYVFTEKVPTDIRALMLLLT